jgi:hypothetical protein
MLKDAAKGQPSHRYQVPLVIADDGFTNTFLYIQNAGLDCTPIELVFREEGSCTETVGCPSSPLVIAAGQTIAIDPVDCVGSGWRGNVEVRAAGRLAIVADLIGPDTVSTYRAVTAIPNPGSNELVGPFRHSEETGWDTDIQVQNLGALTVQAKVSFYDETGAVVSTQTDTICAGGSRSFLLPFTAVLPDDTDTGWIRVESQKVGGETQRLAAIAQLDKYSDAGRSSRREASAYNLLPAGELNSGRVGLPLVFKDLDNSGLTSEIQLAAKLKYAPGSSGVETLDRTFYDVSGPYAADSVSLAQGSTDFSVVHFLGAVAPDLVGSLIVDDPANRARFGAAGVVRLGTLFSEDVPGDEAAVYIGIPLP